MSSMQRCPGQLCIIKRIAPVYRSYSLFMKSRCDWHDYAKGPVVVLSAMEDIYVLSPHCLGWVMNNALFDIEDRDIT